VQSRRQKNPPRSPHRSGAGPRIAADNRRLPILEIISLFTQWSDPPNDNKPGARVETSDQKTPRFQVGFRRRPRSRAKGALPVVRSQACNCTRNRRGVSREAAWAASSPASRCPARSGQRGDKELPFTRTAEDAGKRFFEARGAGLTGGEHPNNRGASHEGRTSGRRRGPFSTRGVLGSPAGRFDLPGVRSGRHERWPPRIQRCAAHVIFFSRVNGDALGPTPTVAPADPPRVSQGADTSHGGASSARTVGGSTGWPSEKRVSSGGGEGLATGIRDSAAGGAPGEGRLSRSTRPAGDVMGTPGLHPLLEAGRGDGEADQQDQPTVYRIGATSIHLLLGQFRTLQPGRSRVGCGGHRSGQDRRPGCGSSY